jgi:hypothetical protein
MSISFIFLTKKKDALGVDLLKDVFRHLELPPSNQSFFGLRFIADSKPNVKKLSVECKLTEVTVSF